MEEKNNETVDLRLLFIHYLLQWEVIAASALISLLLAIVYLVFYPKTFEATAQILLQDDKDVFSSGSFGLGDASGLMKSFGLSSNSGSAIIVDDELLTLTSNQLLREMVIRLGLYVDYYEPWTFKYKMYKKDVPLNVSCDSATLAVMERSIKMDVHHKADGRTLIDAKVKHSTFHTYRQSYDLPALPAVIDVEGTKVSIDYAKNGVGRGKKFHLYVDVNTPVSVAEGMQEDFLIEDYSKSSNVVQMTCEDYEVQRAKDMFAVLIDCFNQQAKDYKNRLAERSLEFIDERMNNALTELGKIEASIEAYKAKNQITMVEYDVQMFAAAMQEIQTKIIELEAKKHLLDMMDKFVHDPANKYKLVPLLYSFDGATAGDATGGALTSYNGVLLERERIIKNSSEHNPMVAPLSLQADQLRESVYLMFDNTKKSLDLTYKDLKDKESAIYVRLGNMPQQERIYVDLKRQQEIYQGVYLLLLQKQEDIMIAIGQGKERARIIDAPYVKSKAVAPRKLYAAIFVVIFTIFLSMGWLSMKWFVLTVWRDLKQEYRKQQAQ